MRRSRYAGAVLALLLLLPCAVGAVQVRATLDRSNVQLGETVTLNVHVEGATGGIDTPDFSALQQDFELLGSSQNRSVSSVNGARHAELTFGLALRPRHAGALRIPALQVAGMRTAALTLQVHPAAAAAAGPAPGTAVFVEARADPEQVSVGQQISYVVRLFYAVNLGGVLDTPQIDGVQTTKIGDDLKYTAERGGRSWNVLERRFVLTPQHAGTLEIPALMFQGEVSDPGDPGGYFGTSVPISARAAPISIDVQAIPASAGATAWLPARELTLTLDGLPDAATPLRVGQPLNLTMRLRATGLAADALPLPTLPRLDGAAVYPDKPVNSIDNAGPWLVGQRQRVFAVVPERAGTLTVPATRVRWWNVLTNRAEVAQIPARQLTVLPAVGAAGAVGGTAATPTTDAAGDKPATTKAPAASATLPWRWIALGSVLVWLLSLGWWWRSRRSRSTPRASATTIASDARPPPRTCQRAFLAAARGHDVAAQTRTLLAWARAERPAIAHLGELAASLDTAQRAAIVDLQRRRYGSAPAAGSPRLADVFKRGLCWRTTDPAADGPGVPPLYPFKLR